MKIGYVRVSTVDQHEDRQLVTMEKYGVEKIFQEKVSGKDTNRPQLQEMLKFIDNFYEFNKQLDENQRQELTLVIHDFSRLARNTEDLLRMVRILQEKNVNLISDKESIDSSDPRGKLLLGMIALINEFERNVLLERQREGIAIAKQKGVYKGRKPIDIDDNIFLQAYNRYKTREINKTQMATELGVSRPTLNKMIKEHEEKENKNV